MGFERGVRGSTAEHLSVLEYKAQKETERATDMTAVVEQKQEAVAALDLQAVRKTKQLGKLDEQIAVKAKAAATVAEIEAMGKPAVFGGFSVSADEISKLKTLAKKSAKADEKVLEMKSKLAVAERERDEAKTQLAVEKKNRPSISEHLTVVNRFLAALRRAPKRIMAVIEDIMQQPPERQVFERSTPELKRSQDYLAI